MNVVEPSDFERFATDHAKHVHCRGCGGCILDPNFLVQAFGATMYCIGCRDRIKAQIARTGQAAPWAYEFPNETRAADPTPAAPATNPECPECGGRRNGCPECGGNVGAA